MTLSEVISIIGNDRVKFQTLENSMVGNITRKKNGTQCSFMTSEAGPEYALGMSDKICLILWIPRKEFESAIKNEGKAT